MYDDIALFIEVVKNNSFSKTAEKLKLQQSTVSRRIQALQQQLKIELFVRDKNSFILTRAGRGFYNKVHEPINVLENVLSDILLSQKKAEGELRVSLAPGLASTKIDPYLHEFGMMYPKIRLKLYYENYDYHPDNNYDLIITPSYPSVNDVKVRKIYSSKLYLACTKRYVFQESLPTTLEEIANHRTVGVRRKNISPQIIDLENSEAVVDYEYHPDIVTSSMTKSTFLAHS